MIYKKIIEMNQEKKRRESLILNTVLDKARNRILNSAKNGASYCYYEVPEFIPGYPLINIEKTMIFLYKELTKENFTCYPVTESVLYITWNIKRDGVKEDKKNEEDKILDSMYIDKIINTKNRH